MPDYVNVRSNCVQSMTLIFFYIHGSLKLNKDGWTDYHMNLHDSSFENRKRRSRFTHLSSSLCPPGPLSEALQRP